MARMKKKGIDWFSVDAHETTEEKLLVDDYGLEIVGLSLTLKRFIARNDYYYRPDETMYKTLTRFYKVTDRERINEMIEALVAAEVFDSQIYNDYGVLVSDDVQRSFKETARGRVKSKKRTDADYKEEVVREYWLLEDDIPYIDYVGLCTGTVPEQSRDNLGTVPEQYRESTRTVLSIDSKDIKESIESKRKDIRVEGELSTDNEYLIMAFSTAIDNHIDNPTTKKNRDNILTILRYFLEQFELFRPSYVHEEYEKDKIISLIKSMLKLIKDDDGTVLLNISDIGLYKKVIRNYFESGMNCDFHLAHFLSGDIRLFCVKEVLGMGVTYGRG